MLCDREKRATEALVLLDSKRKTKQYPSLEDHLCNALGINGNEPLYVSIRLGNLLQDDRRFNHCMKAGNNNDEEQIFEITFHQDLQENHDDTSHLN